jgi:hypothetical protein
MFIFLGGISFTLIQMQFRGAEKRVTALENLDFSHSHETIYLPHTHRYNDGAAVYEEEE